MTKESAEDKPRIERNEVLAQAAIAALKPLSSGDDIEGLHVEADNVLCGLLEALGYEDVINAWHQVEKWYA